MSWRDRLGHFASGKLGREKTDEARRELEQHMAKASAGPVYDPTLAEQMRAVASQQLGISEQQAAQLMNQGAVLANPGGLSPASARSLTEALMQRLDAQAMNSVLAHSRLQSINGLGTTGAWTDEAADIKITLSPPVPFDGRFDDPNRVKIGRGLMIGGASDASPELVKHREEVCARVLRLTGEQMMFDAPRNSYLLCSHYIEKTKFSGATDEEIVAGVNELRKMAAEQFQRIADEERIRQRKKTYELAIKVVQEHDTLAIRIGDTNPHWIVFDQPLGFDEAADLHERSALFDRLRLLRTQQVANAARAALENMRDEIRQQVLAEMGQTQKGKITL